MEVNVAVLYGVSVFFIDKRFYNTDDFIHVLRRFGDGRLVDLKALGVLFIFVDVAQRDGQVIGAFLFALFMILSSISVKFWTNVT